MSDWSPDNAIAIERRHILESEKRVARQEALVGKLIESGYDQRVRPANEVLRLLPLYTLKDVVRVTPEKVAADAIGRVLAAVLFSPEQCCIKSGALYVHDPVVLSKILQAKADTLAEHQVPTDPDQFVAYIAAVWLEPCHPVHAIIAAAFGDIA